MEGDEYLTYDATDCDKDTLRNELLKLDNDISSTSNITPSVAETGLQEIYDAISKKYGLDIGYKDFRSFIKTVADEDKLNMAMNEALGSKVVTAIAQRTQLKLIISMSYLIDRSLDLIEKEAKNSALITPELVGMIDRTIQWFQTLSDIKNSMHISDPDRTMSNLVEKAGIKSNTSNSSSDSVSIEVIRQLANSIKSSESNVNNGGTN